MMMYTPTVTNSKNSTEKFADPILLKKNVIKTNSFENDQQIVCAHIQQLFNLEKWTLHLQLNVDDTVCVYAWVFVYGWDDHCHQQRRYWLKMMINLKDDNRLCR